MSIEEAFKLLKLKYETTEEEARKQYKKMMILYHPDNTNGSEEKAKAIGEAYKIVKDTLSLNKPDMKIISFEEVCNAYANNDEEKINSFDESLFVSFDIFIIIDKDNFKYHIDKRYNNKKYYDISFEIETSTSDTKDIELRIGKFNCNLSMSSKEVRVNIVIDKVRLNIGIQRKVTQ